MNAEQFLQKYDKLIRKYAYSISCNYDLAVTNEDIYSEFCMVALKIFSYYPDLDEQVKGNYLVKALKNKKNEILRHDDTRRKYHYRDYETLQGYVNFPMRNIDFNCTLRRIEIEINRLHKRDSFKKDCAEIIRFIILGATREELPDLTWINKNTIKWRYREISKILRMFYEIEYKRKLNSFTLKEKKQIMQELQSERLIDVAFRWNIKKNNLSHIVTEMNKKGDKRTFNGHKTIFKKEAEQIILKHKELRPYSILASKVKNEMEDLYKFKDSYMRWYRMVLKMRDKGLLIA